MVNGKGDMFWTMSASQGDKHRLTGEVTDENQVSQGDKHRFTGEVTDENHVTSALEYI